MSYYFRPPNSREQNLFIVRTSIDDLKLRKEINGYLHTRLKYLGIKTLDEVGKMTIKDVTRLGGVGDAILYDLKKVMIKFDIIFDWYEWRRVIVRYY